MYNPAIFGVMSGTVNMSLCKMKKTMENSQKQWILAFYLVVGNKLTLHLTHYTCLRIRETQTLCHVYVHIILKKSRMPLFEPNGIFYAENVCS